MHIQSMQSTRYNYVCSLFDFHAQLHGAGAGAGVSLVKIIHRMLLNRFFPLKCRVLRDFISILKLHAIVSCCCC